MSTTNHDLDVKPISEQSTPKVKPAPKRQAIPVPFAYTPSNDGTDENLLILLHGLGDTHQPFAKLGKQLTLPQCATLALRAPQQIPYLEEEAFQWYKTFDDLAETIVHPDPTPAIQLMDVIVKYLVEDCSWPASRIHILGYAQGGTVALEFGLDWWRSHGESRGHLGSIVSIAGPLLSFPTTMSNRCPTPVLNLGPSQSSIEKAYSSVKALRAPPGGCMPASKQEWEPIMRFWSERLSKRLGEGDLFEVLTGST